MSTEPEKNDKEAIQIEEREKMMNEENKAQDVKEETPKDKIEKEESKTEESEVKTQKTDSKEGREVKPKKIPIGGIQMPGFFTRSKSKERCKEEERDTEATELLETETTDKKDEKTEEPKSRIKLPFMMKKAKSTGDEDKSGEPSQKKRLIDTIRLPLVSVFPRRQKTEDKSAATTQAGLASMETLGDDIDKGEKTEEKEMKNIKLDNDNVNINFHLCYYAN